MGATLRLNSKGGARWHPYHTSRITTQHSAPTLSTTGLDTPLSTHSQTVDSFQHQPPRQLTAQYLLYHKERIDARRIQKEKFDSALKEFCVKRLSDIWKETSYVKNSVYSRSTYRAPYSTSSFKDEEPAQVKLGSYLSPPLSPSPFAFQAHAGLIPTRGMSLKPFVFDVLRRSKTLWPALQVALCYLDTVRDKVTEAMAEAERGQGLAAAEADLESLFNFGNTNEPTTDSKPATGNATSCHPVTQTVSPPASEDGYATGCTQSGPATTDPSAQEPPRRVRRRKVPTVPPAPLPPRPSPLLCARRMFIAALILACKFTQDRVYSNRAWARICGLDAREVSRCERALGEALQWRLWVGKGVTDERAAFVRQFMQTEEGAPSLRPETTQTSIKKSPSADCALLTPQSSSGSPFTSPPEAVTPAPLTKSMSLPSEFFYSQATPTQTFSRDFSTALKKTSSWCHADAPAYNASQLTMTPANADLDAMDYEQGITAAHNANSLGRGVYFSPYGSTPSLTYDTPSAASITSSSDEYSFIPTGAVSSPTSFSQCTPSAKQEENDFSMPTPIKGVSMHTMHRQSGVERTFEVKLCDYDIVSSQPDASCVRKEY